MSRAGEHKYPPGNGHKRYRRTEQLQTDSRPVSSNQPWLHPKLGPVVGRHLAERWRKPIAAHNREAFASLAEAQAADPRPLVLDSFCGTGLSTQLLAQRHPGHRVVGIDQSDHRLQRHQDGDPGNYLLLRAQCEDIWQLLQGSGWQVDFHYLLYPNPWPKSAHLKRRIHGHPAFPLLISLGGQIELRSNWVVYAEEFGVAMGIAGRAGLVQRLAEPEGLTLFEQKYHRSGHQLWRFRSPAAVTNAGL